MKIRPYRVCDICGEEYHKTHNCMRVKILIDPMRYTEMYGDLPIMSKWDICPKCAEDLMAELMLKVADRKTDTPLDKDINVRSKTESQTCDTCKYDDAEWYVNRCDECVCGNGKPSNYVPKDTPQTEKSNSEYYLELADAVMRGEMSDASANQAWYEYINKQDTPQTERDCFTCKHDDTGDVECADCDDDYSGYEPKQTDCGWK